MPITPHIVVQGAEGAAAFYREAFGAEEVDRIPTPDGRLMSVQLRLAGGVVHLADEFPEMGVLAPPSIGGTPVVLALEVEDAEAVFAQAVAAGATVRQPLADMFWGDRHGQLTILSDTAGTSASMSATSRTTRSSPPTRDSSHDYATARWRGGLRAVWTGEAAAADAEQAGGAGVLDAGAAPDRALQ
jgi:PhnB protein